MSQVFRAFSFLTPFPLLLPLSLSISLSFYFLHYANNTAQIWSLHTLGLPFLSISSFSILIYSSFLFIPLTLYFSSQLLFNTLSLSFPISFSISFLPLIHSKCTFFRPHPFFYPSQSFSFFSILSLHNFNYIFNNLRSIILWGKFLNSKA